MLKKHLITDGQDVVKIMPTPLLLYQKKGKKIMKKLIALMSLICTVVTMTACTEADRVSENLSREADNFNIRRQLTVINCLKGDVLFQMTGCFSIKADANDHQLEITVRTEDNTYKKHFVGLSDNVAYVVEDVTGKNVNQYQYTLNFNPKMWLPIDMKTY